MISYKDFATNLSLKAGGIIKENFLAGVKREWKLDNTPITVVDKEVNSLVIKSINETYTGHAILGEEESSMTDSEYIWVCDPIDGTVPFSHGYPISVFTLSLVHNGEVILGTIYDPYLDRLMVAEKGKGTWLNGNKVLVSDVKDLKNTVINVETWVTAPNDLIPLYGKLMKQSVMVTLIRSTVYAGMLVAMGEFAGVYFAGKTAWDAAAVKICVEEAGGKVTDLEGKDQRYDRDINGFIASNGLLHEQLKAQLKA
jgi:myo-inositol-1(or 4)-monophosphatase